MFATACWTASAVADEIWFRGEQKPHVGELVEETPRSLLIKFPKEQIRLIQRGQALEGRPWQERRILWQDTGDTIVLTLPKERIESSGTGEAEKTQSITEGLRAVGTSGPEPAGKMMDGTGRVEGRVLSRGNPLPGCRVILVARGIHSGLLSKLISGNKSFSGAPPWYEALTDLGGKYALEEVVIGEYDVYWLPPGEKQWTRKLSETPNLTVMAGETIRYQDIYVP